MVLPFLIDCWVWLVAAYPSTNSSCPYTTTHLIPYLVPLPHSPIIALITCHHPVHNPFTHALIMLWYRTHNMDAPLCCHSPCRYLPLTLSCMHIYTLIPKKDKLQRKRAFTCKTLFSHPHITQHTYVRRTCRTHDVPTYVLTPHAYPMRPHAL